MSDFDAFEDRLRTGRRGVLRKLSERIAVVERLRPWMVAIGVAGAFVAAAAKAVEGAAGTVMAIAGALVAAIGGLIVAALDFKKLELGASLTEVEKVAEEAIATGRGYESGQSAAEQLDAKRRSRFLAIEQMIEVVEAGLVKRADAQSTAERMLRRSIAAIRHAVDYTNGDFFTISIFRRAMGADGIERMERIAAQWTDPDRAERGGRSWELGKGYTGVAWHRALAGPGDVIVEDRLLPAFQGEFPVDRPDPDREALYRSVAAIPILVRRSNHVWGVVTATSDRPGCFRRDRSNVRVQNVDMIRDIARIAALLAGHEAGVEPGGGPDRL